jgi:two-component system sensor histidine kinase RegB
MNTRPAPEFLLASLRYVLWMRMAVAMAQVLSLAAAWWFLHLQAAWVEIGLVIAVMLAVTWRSFIALQGGTDPDESEFFRQLMFDVAALAVFLYFTGGATNPFAPLFLLPVVVAVATLRARRAWVIAAVAAAFYTVLMFAHVPLHLHGDAGSEFALHVWGMWVGFLLAAVLVACFVSQIGVSLRARDAELARNREQALRTEQVLALGTLAAGTAHELGTPLSTMAVVVGELLQARADDAALAPELALLRSQIARCKKILLRMSRSAGQAQAHGGGPVDAAAYLRDLVAAWRRDNPRLDVSLDIVAAGPPPALVADQTLTQAIVNVLDNAARASPRAPELRAEWDEGAVTVTVRDYGAGIPTEIEAGGGCVTEIRLPPAPRPVVT